MPDFEGRVARVVDDDVPQPRHLLRGVLRVVVLLVIIIVGILTLDAHDQHRPLPVVLVQRSFQSREVGLLRVQRTGWLLLLLGGRHARRRQLRATFGTGESADTAKFSR